MGIFVSDKNINVSGVNTVKIILPPSNQPTNTPLDNPPSNLHDVNLPRNTHSDNQLGKSKLFKFEGFENF